MKNKWMHFGLDRESIFGLACAVIMVLLSTAMALFQNEIGNIILRDVFMILILGFLMPLYYILVTKKKKLSVLGIHKNKLSASLVINAAAGIFEMVFIYGFLRYEFERAFGILPAILITAIFYSFHHAGFQPEFTKLFFVGLMYVTVFYFTHNIFSIFPFFWGVGAVWDVLVNSQAGSQIRNKTSFIIAVAMYIAMAGISIFIHCRVKSEYAGSDRSCL